MGYVRFRRILRLAIVTIFSKFLTVLSLFFTSIAVNAQELIKHTDSHSEVAVYAEQSAFTKGETLWLAFRIEPKEGWHSYWKNYGDSGAAPILDWTLPEGISAGEPLFGAPHRMPVGPLMNYGYEDASTLLIPLYVSESYQATTADIKLSAEWLVCELECVPQVGEWSFSLNSGNGEAVNSTIFADARSALPELSYWDATLSVSQEASELLVFVDESELSGLKAAYFYPESEGVTVYAEAQAYEISGDGLRLRIPREGDLEPTTANGVLELTFENGSKTVLELEPTLNSALGLAANVSETIAPTNVNNLPIWQAAVFAFLGGIILNLMPCVFPVLSLKAFALISANHKTSGGRKREGWAYTFGIWISFMVIVSALMILRAGGAAVGWGFQLQDPIFVGLLAILMVLVALSLGGMFNIGLGSAEGAGQELTEKEGLKGAFFKGVLATLVATPCTAPLMAPAIGFALTQSVPTVALVFSMLAFGLALPFLALSYSDKLARMMPRPGAWMEKVKQGLAFPMLLTAAWLIYIFDLQAGSTATMILLMGIVGVSFGLWLWQQTEGKIGRSIAVIVAVFSMFAAINKASTSEPAQVAQSEDVVAYTPKAVADLQKEGGPIFVYFTAEWCITCKVNEQVALNNADVKAALAAKNVTIVKGDWTNRNSEIAAVLAKYGRAGVPLYLYYPAGQAEAVVLPEILTPSIVIDTL